MIRVLTLLGSALLREHVVGEDGGVRVGFLLLLQGDQGFGLQRDEIYRNAR